MKRDIDTLRRCCLFLMNDMVENNRLKDLPETHKTSIKNMAEEHPMNKIRNYSQIRNKLLRLIKGFSPYHQIQLINSVASMYTIAEVIELTKNVWDSFGTPQHDPEFTLPKLLNEFTLISIGKS